MIEVISVNENQQIEYHKYRAATCHVAHSQTFAETTKVQGINKLDIDSFFWSAPQTCLQFYTYNYMHRSVHVARQPKTVSKLHLCLGEMKEKNHLLKFFKKTSAKKKIECNLT